MIVVVGKDYPGVGVGAFVFDCRGHVLLVWYVDFHVETFASAIT